MEEIINHEEAEQLALQKRDESNLARCYLDMKLQNSELRELLDEARREAEAQSGTIFTLTKERNDALRLYNELLDAAYELTPEPTTHFYAKKSVLMALVQKGITERKDPLNQDHDIERLIETERALGREVRCDCGVPGCNKLYDHRK